MRVIVTGGPDSSAPTSSTRSCGSDADVVGDRRAVPQRPRQRSRRPLRTRRVPPGRRQRPRTRTSNRRRRRAVCQQAGSRRARRGFRRRRRLRRRQRSRNRTPPPHAARHTVPRTTRTCQQHGRLRRKTEPLPVDRSSCREPRTGDTIAAGRADSPCPRCGAACHPSRYRKTRRRTREASTATSSTRNASTSSSDATRPAGHRATLPQRLRTPDAPQHAIRQRRQHLPQRTRPGPSATGPRRQPPTTRIRPRRRHRRANLSRSRPDRLRRGRNIASRNPQAVGELAHRSGSRPVPPRHRRLPSGRSRAGDVRHVFTTPTPRLRSWTSRPRSRSTRGSTNRLGSDAPTDMPSHEQ